MEISRYKRHQKILVAVDCIIFGFDGTQMKALIIKRGFDPPGLSVQQREWDQSNSFYFLPIKLDEMNRNELLIQNPQY